MIEGTEAALLHIATGLITDKAKELKFSGDIDVEMIGLDAKPRFPMLRVRVRYPSRAGSKDLPSGVHSGHAQCAYGLPSYADPNNRGDLEIEKFAERATIDCTRDALESFRLQRQVITEIVEVQKEIA